MAPIERLTDSRIRSLVKQPRTEEESVADGAVPGLYLRLYPGGSASWTLFYRVVGEGGTNRHGKPLVGKKHRLGLGFYPKVSLQAVRAKANNLIELAMQGIIRRTRSRRAQRPPGLTVQALSDVFMKEHVLSRGLDSVHLYVNAFKVHINPQIGERLTDLVTREEVRAVMN
jgi:hypothetical protein